MITATNIFLGVGPAIYSDPLLASEVLTAVLPENLGADAFVLAEAYTEIDPKTGTKLKELLKEHAQFLRDGLEFNTGGTPKNMLASWIRETDPGIWRAVLEKAKKHTWAFQRGWLNTAISPHAIFCAVACRNHHRKPIEELLPGADHPTLQDWLHLKVEEEFTIPAELILDELTQNFRSYFATLLKPAIYLDHATAQYQEYCQILKSLGFTSLDGITLLSEIEKQAGLAIPKKVTPLDNENVAQAIQFLTQLISSGFAAVLFNEADLEIVLAMMHDAASTAVAYEEVEKYGPIRCHVSLLQRDLKWEDLLKIPESRRANLQTQILVVSLPNGDILKGYALHLYQSVFDGKRRLFFSRIEPLRMKSWWHTSPVQGFIEKAMTAVLEEVMERMGAKSLHALRESDIPNWMHGSIPITHALDADFKSEQISVWEHPYHSFFKPGDGSHEAMRVVDGATLAMLNPWVGLRNDRFAADLLLREIDPNPDFQDSSQYLFGFSTGTGRSVDYAIDYTGPDGTHWHHLNAIGVGKTEKARTGVENRDGLLPLEGAKKRFYFSNLMHYLGLRTSLAIAVVDRKQIREDGEKSPGIPQTQATLYELRREQLRLDDLEKLDAAIFALDRIKPKHARDMGKTNMSDEEYVTWLAQTLGEQFAIMEYFGFDHGIIEGAAQLHPGNIGLDGSIYDFDSARLTRNRETLHERYENGKEIVSRRMIWAWEQEWRNSRSPKSWLGHLLHLAPNIDFYDIMTRAEQEKKEALQKSVPDPKAKIHEFNVNYWNPYMRGLRQMLAVNICSLMGVG